MNEENVRGRGKKKRHRDSSSSSSSSSNERRKQAKKKKNKKEYNKRKSSSSSSRFVLYLNRLSCFCFPVRRLHNICSQILPLNIIIQIDFWHVESWNVWCLKLSLSLPWPLTAKLVICLNMTRDIQHI